LFLPFGWTFLDNPAGPGSFAALLEAGQQKIELPLHMGRDIPPTLLVTVDRLQGDPQQVGNLLLGLVQIFPEFYKFTAIHIPPLKVAGVAKSPSSPAEFTISSTSMPENNKH
jgi:hypothetical protein